MDRFCSFFILFLLPCVNMCFYVFHLLLMGKLNQILCIALPTTTTASDAMFDMFTCNFTGVQHPSIFILPTALFVKLMACRLFLKLYFSILNVLHFSFYCFILYQCPFYFYLFYCKHFKSYNLFKARQGGRQRCPRSYAFSMGIFEKRGAGFLG